MDSLIFQGSLVNSDRILYTASDFAKSNLLHMQEIGKLQANKPHSSKRENLFSYLFFIVESGSGVIEYGNRTFSLSANDCVFIDCRKAYSHHTSDDLWSLRWVHFYGPNMAGIYEKYVERGGLCVFHPAHIERYLQILTELFNTAKSSSYVKDMIISEKLSELLTCLMEDSWNPSRSHKTNSKKQNLQDIKQYLEAHYTEQITLEQLACTFYVNKFYLTRIFKEQFGSTINNYLQQIRITHAKQLLRFSDLSIEEIGHRCGMSDANYFSRIFKKVEGVAPGEFRKVW